MQVPSLQQLIAQLNEAGQRQVAGTARCHENPQTGWSRRLGGHTPEASRSPCLVPLSNARLQCRRRRPSQEGWQPLPSQRRGGAARRRSQWRRLQRRGSSAPARRLPAVRRQQAQLAAVAAAHAATAAAMVGAGVQITCFCNKRKHRHSILDLTCQCCSTLLPSCSLLLLAPPGQLLPAPLILL